MQMVFRRKWEAAHRFCESENRQSLCSQPHGHTWWVEVYLSSNLELNKQTNMLVSFEKAKKTWHKWIDDHVDHSFKLNYKDPLVEFMMQDNPQGRLLITPGDPTTEVLTALFKAKLEAFLKVENPNLICESLKMEETKTNAIILKDCPQKYLPQSDNLAEFWWNRPDFSTQDLNK